MSRVGLLLHDVVSVVRPAVAVVLGQQAERSTTAGWAAGKGVRRMEAGRVSGIAACDEMLAKSRTGLADEPTDGTRVVAGRGRGMETANRVSSLV